MPKGEVAGSEKDGHEDETDEHRGSVGENRVEAALRSGSYFTAFAS
jgi:hypothetical protein